MACVGMCVCSLRPCDGTAAYTYTRSDVRLHLVHLGLRLDRLDHGEDREAALVQEVAAHVVQVGQVTHTPSERGVGVGRVAGLAKVRARAAARDSAGRGGTRRDTTRRGGTGRSGARRGSAGREEPKVVDDGGGAVGLLGVEEDGELALALVAVRVDPQAPLAAKGLEGRG